MPTIEETMNQYPGLTREAAIGMLEIAQQLESENKMREEALAAQEARKQAIKDEIERDVENLIQGSPVEPISKRIAFAKQNGILDLSFETFLIKRVCKLTGIKQAQFEKLIADAVAGMAPPFTPGSFSQDEDDDSDDGDDKESRPIIKVRSQEIGVAADLVVKTLRELEIGIFVNADRLVEIAPITTQFTRRGNEPDSFEWYDAEMTGLRPVTLNRLYYICEKQLCFRSWNGKAFKNSKPSKDVLAMVLYRATAEAFFTVRGFFDGMILTSNGRLLHKPGYDRETGLFNNARQPFENAESIERATVQDAQYGIWLFKQLLSEFVFKTPLDEAVAITALIGAVMRPMFPVAPPLFISAHMSGSGKTYLGLLIGYLATGAVPPTIAAANGKAGVVELEKQLTAAALAGYTFILVDNVAEHINSPLLNTMGSNEKVSLRIMGTSDMPTIDNVFMIVLTGNQVGPSGDDARRMLPCWLDPKTENPELRHFNGNPLEMLKANRKRYLAAALAIVAAHINVKRQPGYVADSRAPLAGFEMWDSMIRRPMLTVGLIDPVEAQTTSKQLDPTRRASGDLLKVLVETMGFDTFFTTREFIEKASTTNDKGAYVWESAANFLMDAFGVDRRVWTPKRFGNGILTNNEGIPHNGLKLTRVKENWKIVNAVD